MCHTRHSGASIDQVKVFNTLQEVRKRSWWHHSLPRPLRNKVATLALRVEVLLTSDCWSSGTLTHEWKVFADVFGGSGFLATAANRLGLRGHVLDTTYGPRYYVTKPFVLTRIRQDVSAGKCGRNDFHFRDNTLRALTKLFPPVLLSLTCLIVLACRGFWNTRVIRGSGTCRKSNLLRHSFPWLGPWRTFVFFLDLYSENE